MSTEAGHSFSEIHVYSVVPDSSAVLVEARSNVGPISFGTMSIQGEASVAMTGPTIDSAVPLTATIEIPVLSLESGNSLYDSELCQRLDQRRFPVITVELRAATSLGGGRFSVEGDVTIHGTTRRLTGAVTVTMADENVLVAEGSELIDIRDFEIRVPAMFMLKIYPDVSVQFRVTAARV